MAEAAALAGGPPCPACAGTTHEAVDAQRGVPTNSCLLLPDQEQALAGPRGDLDLRVCLGCGFLFNAAFDARLPEYSARYEESQHASPTFVAFARGLAARWVARHGLAGRRVLEIGCGSRGEFLQLVVEAGAGHAVGVDPALKPGQIDSEAPERFTWVVDRFDPRHLTADTDAVLCRHTLEHIAPVRAFLATLRRALGERRQVPVLFELPDVRRVLEEGAFWDVYYEHCSYFAAGSLARLFRATGFAVEGLERAYGDQYLLLEARPSIGQSDTAPFPIDGAPAELTLPIEEEPAELAALARTYRERVERTIGRWRRELEEVRAAGGKAVLWGGGSKAVAFLNRVRPEGVEYVVDVNPAKHGMLVAGTGQRIVAPELLASYRPALVVVMNPVYLGEVGARLAALGVGARLEGV